MTFDELMAIIGTDDAPETIYDDLRNSHTSEIEALGASHSEIIAAKDSEIAQLQASIDTLKTQIFDAESNPDAGNPDVQDSSVGDDNISIDDLFS